MTRVQSAIGRVRLAFRLVPLAAWSLRLSWRLVTGRLFIFRDAPMWVCCAFLMGASDDLHQLAAEEIALRLNNLAGKLRRGERVSADALK